MLFGVSKKYFLNVFVARTILARSMRHCSVILTPSLPQPVKFLGSKCTDVPADSLLSGSASHLLSVLRVLTTVLSHASVKKAKGF